MAVLQAYQTDLLKDLDQSKRLSPEAVLELCRATDLALRSTKQTATAMNTGPTTVNSNISLPDQFQEIVDSLHRILTTTASTTTTSPTVVACLLAKPVPYSGSVEDCNGFFLLLCPLALEMQLHLYTSDRVNIAFIISLLTGKALPMGGNHLGQAGTVKQSIDNSVNHFHEVFGKPVGDTSVGEQLHHFHQRKMSINDYALKFRTLAAASRWNERSLLTTYRQGLETRVWLHLTSYEVSKKPEPILPNRLIVSPIQWCPEPATSSNASTATLPGCPPELQYVPRTQRMPLTNCAFISRHWPPRSQ
ncbi:Retrotransposon-derived protein PEG10 [Anabarilius grahami]|uniref:Retrotransposon-derived protein PEG10 n=1 Tax=Anabarilius grahami TaxID=495550 RepID=A0A3N0Y506_ANAGA|nr:Retrotransposon-derived protein PEG10 [Anabarilius grahami]